MKHKKYTTTGQAQDFFVTTPPPLNRWQQARRSEGVELFTEYLQEKYEYISKMDMLTNEKEARKEYGLTPNDAIKIWNELYKDTRPDSDLV